MMAALSGKVSAVKVLLEDGHANVHARSLCGTTAMHYAAKEATVRLLIGHGASVNVHASYCRGYLRTPLCRAIDSGNVPVLKVLLQHDATVDDILEDGQSILHVGEKSAEVFGILLDHCRSTMTEAKFNSFLLHSNKYGRIAYEVASSLQIANLLIEQPRGRDQKLSPACHAQLIHDRLILYKSSYSSWARCHRATFESLALSVPCDVKEPNAKTRRETTLNDEIAVKLNPSLNSFQWSVAQEALDLVIDATDCQDYIVETQDTDLGALRYVATIAC